MSRRVAEATLENVIGDGRHSNTTRMLAAHELIQQVQGVIPGSPQAQTFADVVAAATAIAEANNDPRGRIEAAKVLLLAEEG